MSDENEPAEKPDETEKPRRRRAKADGEICAQCWPDGWPGDNSGASCIHGAWTR